MTDCTHFCLDTAPTLRAWAIGLLVATDAADREGWAAASARGSEFVASSMAEAASPDRRASGSGAACIIPTEARVQLRLVRGAHAARSSSGMRAREGVRSPRAG